MARRFGTEKVSRAIVTVSSVCPTKTDVVPAQAGFAYNLKQIVATNNNLTAVGLKICEGNDVLLPTVVLPASGTLFWDVPGGGEMELAIGSGITACVIASGTSVQVAAYYVPHDENAGITKEAARTATYIPSNATATRIPNFFGDQVQS